MPDIRLLEKDFCGMGKQPRLTIQGAVWDCVQPKWSESEKEERRERNKNVRDLLARLVEELHTSGALSTDALLRVLKDEYEEEIEGP